MSPATVLSTSSLIGAASSAVVLARTTSIVLDERTAIPLGIVASAFIFIFGATWKLATTRERERAEREAQKELIKLILNRIPQVNVEHEPQVKALVEKMEHTTEPTVKDD